MTILQVTDANFDDVIKSEKPVLIDFSAPWCEPCERVAQSLMAISDKMAAQVTIGKLDIDDNPDTPRRYGVRGIPMMMLFRDSRLIAEKIGELSEGLIRAWIEEELA